MIHDILSRRRFLKTAGVSLALPWLDALLPKTAQAADMISRRNRLVAIGVDLGLYAGNFFPTKPGRNYPLSKYLQPLESLRNDFTVFSGMCHPDCFAGHYSVFSFLSGAPFPGRPGYRPTITMDQLIAENLRGQTRFDSLVLSTARIYGSSRLSHNRNGVPLPHLSEASTLFAQLFLKGTDKEVQQQVNRLRRGKSVLETVQGKVKGLEKHLGARDREKLDEYFTSVRDCEKQLVTAQEWMKKPKPHVDYAPPKDPADPNDLMGKNRLMFDLMFLALQTDSSRAIVMNVDDIGGAVPGLPGVTDRWHPLSHHGQDKGRLEQLGTIELEIMKTFAQFLTKLKGAQEDGESLLDRTMVFLGSHLGSASSHDNHNLPVLLAGGRFDHGQHIAFDTNPRKNKPLGRLFLSMLQQFGLEIDKFAGCDRTLTELKAKRS